MTLRDWIIKANLLNAKERLSKLIEAEAPHIMIEMQEKLVHSLENGTLKIGGEQELLETEYISHEKRVGRGGRAYIHFNDSINYFPQAKYGHYISKGN